MKTTHRRKFLAAAISIVATSGCLHHNRTLAPCTPVSGETECWESFRADRDGRLQHHIVERITESTECDEVTIEQTSFVDGYVVLRVQDTLRCGIVERRIADRYDVEHGVLERVISADSDRDDVFETSRTVSVPLSTSLNSLSGEAARFPLRAGKAVAETPPFHRFAPSRR